MCETCNVRKALEEEDLEASALLLMLINKIHGIVSEDGGIEINAKLTPAEADWFCAWGSENADAEDDDPLEDDIPPEESEQLETDSRFRFD